VLQKVVPTLCTGLNTSGFDTWLITECTGGCDISGNAINSYAGEATCSTTSGYVGNAANPSIGGGTYCWCRMTKINGSTVTAGMYLFRDNYTSAAACEDNCAFDCGDSAAYDRDTQLLLFYIAGWF
jgi:hypothetical protein